MNELYELNKILNTTDKNLLKVLAIADALASLNVKNIIFNIGSIENIEDLENYILKHKKVYLINCLEEINKYIAINIKLTLDYCIKLMLFRLNAVLDIIKPPMVEKYNKLDPLLEIYFIGDEGEDLLESNPIIVFKTKKLIHDYFKDNKGVNNGIY